MDLKAIVLKYLTTSRDTNKPAEHHLDGMKAAVEASYDDNTSHVVKAAYVEFGDTKPSDRLVLEVDVMVKGAAGPKKEVVKVTRREVTGLG